MFKQKQNKKAEIDTLIGAKTRINGDVEFTGGFHLDGYINGNVKCESSAGATLSVSEQGCIEGSVIVAQCHLERHRQGRHRCDRAGRTGPQGAGFGQCSLHRPLKPPWAPKYNGKLIHRVKAGPGAADSGSN